MTSTTSSPTRRLVLVLCAAASITLAATLPTSAQDAEPTSLELIQAVESKVLGGLNVPAFWSVTETPDGVRALEGNHPQPAAIEVGMLELPAPIDANAMAKAFTAELSASVQGLEVVEEVILDADKDTKQLYLELKGSESHLVRFGVVFVVGKHRALIASLSAPDERFDAFTARDLLRDILATIR